MSQLPDPSSEAELSELPYPTTTDDIYNELVELRQGVERIAAHLVPLLSDHHRGVEQRARDLEQQVLHRRERPVAVRIGHLLAEVQRLVEGDQARVHAIEGLLDLLYQLGYEQFGEVGEPYDAQRHEAVEGATSGSRGRVGHVFVPGLWSFGDVVVRARVAVTPKEEDS